MRKTLFYILCILLGIQSYGQNLAHVRGTIFDESKKPLGYSQIVLLNSNNKPIAGVKSNDKGEFQFQNIPYGQYMLNASFIGWIAHKQSIHIQSPSITVGRIILQQNKKQIQEVIVSAQRSTKASNIDKREYSPSQLLNSQNASAAELINSIPSMNIGGESNNLSFRGDENVAVMINGKMTSLTGENLSQIPANSIEKIEVISVPNSKYNSEGSAGVINIVLKSAKANLNSGYILGSVGTNNKYNGQIGYNWSSGKWAIASSYNYTYHEFENYGTSHRRYLNNYDLYHYEHSSLGERTKRLHNLRLGVDYEIDKRNTLSLLGSISKDWGSSYSHDQDTFYDQAELPYNRWTLSNTQQDINMLYDVNLGYTHIMPNDKDKLSIELTRSDNQNDKSEVYNRAYSIYQRLATPYLNQYSVSNIQRRPITSMQADYLMNVSPSNILETGIRLANRDFRFTNLYTDISAGNTVAPQWTNDFGYEENVYSLYGLVSSTWSERWMTKIGLRLEQTNTQSYNNDSALYQYQYFNAFPSAMIRYQLRKKAGNISLSYSMRINRPNPGQLNPLQDVADPISKRYGNPTLKPEHIHSYEVAYGNDISKAISLSTSVYYKLSNNSMTRFLTPNTDGTFQVTVDNIGKQQFIGWELISSLKINPNSSINLSSNLSYNQLDYTAPTGQYYEQNYLNFQGRVLWNYKLPLGIESQVIGFYKSPMKSPQGTIDFMSNVDITLRKRILGTKGMLILSVFDIFNDTKFQIQASDYNFQNYFVRKRETRYATLTFRYNFGSESSNTKKPKVEKPESRDSGGGDMGM